MARKFPPSQHENELKDDAKKNLKLFIYYTCVVFLGVYMFWPSGYPHHSNANMYQTLSSDINTLYDTPIILSQNIQDLISIQFGMV